MTYQYLSVEKSGDTNTVTLNRPHKLNALCPGLLVELKEVLADLRADTSCRFVIFTGAGKAFSAGADLSEEALSERTAMPGLQNERQWQAFAHDMMNAMEDLEQITIGAVNGVAVGGAVCLLLNCDFRIASEKASFIIPETALGMPLSWGATPRLVALIGPSKTKEMLMTCDTIDAAEAHRIGLVNKVVPPEKLMESCREMAVKIGARGPLAVRMCKKQVNAASVARMKDLYLFEADLMDLCLLAGDTVEGAISFMEKRPPRFPTAESAPPADFAGLKTRSH
jgi:enoyl-CoA hydratase/carnithine racemase